MVPKIIGLTGRAGSGKSEVARHLVHHYNYYHMKFADPLKFMLTHFLRMTGTDDMMIERMIEGDLKEEGCSQFMGQSPRHAMQTLGTEWGRDCIDERFRVQTLKRRVMQEDGPIVVDDLRFNNEAVAITKMGGFVYEVTRPDQPWITPHSSEGGIMSDLIDSQIVNNGDVGFLRDLVDAIIEEQWLND